MINAIVKDNLPFTPQERYDWSRRFVTVNYLKMVDKNDRRRIAKFLHDDGREFIIPFENFMYKETILGKKFLVQRFWLFNNINLEKKNALSNIHHTASGNINHGSH
ncbi:MAG: hypothetical protein K0U78_15380 [Actinomycetia bacterium]|nr:hypothetical protein [Actinomycetes bacterium]